jgi:hypothetical protein
MVQESLVTLRCMFIVLMLNQLKYSLHYIIIKVLSYLKSFDQVCRKKCIKVYHANLVLLDSSYNIYFHIMELLLGAIKHRDV